MIYDLCNLYSDINLDTFFRISVIESSQLPKFTHLDGKNSILAILNSIPDTFQAIKVPFLPEKFDISHETKNDENIVFRTKISFPLLPQDAALKDLLETYNKRNVIAFLKRHNSYHLYGTSQHPLELTYGELHASNHAGAKGYNLDINGETPGSAVYFSQAEIGENPIIQGLAFQLAGTL